MTSTSSVCVSSSARFLRSDVPQHHLDEACTRVRI